ncbi:S8 family serine peptidase [Natronospira sp.]|uniref:S8 family serine peptidase n=1 Tax=Natronospira sp. TaxID=2024970 RepID=UPI003873CCD7
MKKFVLGSSMALAMAAGSVAATGADTGGGNIDVWAGGSVIGGSAGANKGKILGLDHPDRIPGSYIVVLNDDVSGVQNVGATAQSLASEVGFDVGREFSTAIQGFTVETGQRGFQSTEALKRLAADPRVDFVEADRQIWLQETVQDGATWGLDRIDQRDLPLDNQYVYDADGSGVEVYIIDTGINTSHQDFGGRVAGGVNTVDNDGIGDCNGHGTHVASSAAGSTYGVAKNADLYSVRVFGCSGGTTTQAILDGIDWAVSNMSGPAVANLSLGGGASQALDNAVNNGASAGMTMVVAAGNENQNACNVSPARADQAFTVGSTTSNDSRSNFSNWGSCVDIFAPGSDITAAWHTSNSATNTISGTSMAAPHVAGVAALYLGENPSASPAQVESALVGEATEGRISGVNGSPNLLLYSRVTEGSGGDDGDDGDDGGDDGGGDDGGSDDSVLENGEAVSGLSGSQGDELRFTMEVPADASELVFDMIMGSGVPDMYVRFGAEPTLNDWDCRPYEFGNDETCEFSDPDAGTWHVMIHAYNDFSGVTLVGNHDGGSDDGGGGDDGDDGGSEPGACPGGYEEFTGSLSGGRGTSTHEPDGTYYQAGAGTHNGILTSPDDAIFDLYLQRWSGWSWSDVAESLPNSGSEAAEISYDGSSGFYVWRLEIWNGSGDYVFCMDTP